MIHLFLKLVFYFLGFYGRHILSEKLKGDGKLTDSFTKKGTLSCLEAYKDSCMKCK